MRVWTYSSQGIGRAICFTGAIRYKTAQLLLNRIEITGQGGYWAEAPRFMGRPSAILRDRGFDFWIPLSKLLEKARQNLLHFSNHALHGRRGINEIRDLDVVLHVAAFQAGIFPLHACENIGFVGASRKGAQSGKTHTKAYQPTQEESSRRRFAHCRWTLRESIQYLSTIGRRSRATLTS